MQQTISSPKVKKIAPWIVGIAIIATLGSAAIIYSKTANTSSKENPDRTVIAKIKDLVVPIDASGVVQAVRRINLSPFDSGRIVAMYVNEGDRVEKGQIIARIESDSFQADVDRYRAGLARAEATLAEKLAGSRPEEIAKARAKVKTASAQVDAAIAALNGAIEQRGAKQKGFNNGVISRAEYNEYLSKQLQAEAQLEAKRATLIEQQESLQKAINGSRPTEIAVARAELLEAKAQLAGASTKLNNTIIRAPFAGIITRTFARVGDFITPTTTASDTVGATSASIAELSSGREIEAKIPEAIIAKVNTGQTVEIRTDAYPDRVFQGRVSSIAPRAIRKNNVTYFQVKVSISETETKLKLGMNTKVTFLSDPISDALVIPLAAIVTRSDGQTGVFVISSEGEEEFKLIKVSAVSGLEIRVIEGLAAGDRVLIYPPSSEKVEGID